MQRWSLHCDPRVMKAKQNPGGEASGVRSAMAQGMRPVHPWSANPRIIAKSVQRQEGDAHLAYCTDIGAWPEECNP
jgi:hypothetical protein